jgi:hypothetical protein
MSYPLVRDLAAEGILVRLTCGVLGHSRQAYYAWLADPVSQRELEDAYLTNALIDAPADAPEFWLPVPGQRARAPRPRRRGTSGGCAHSSSLWSATVRKGRRGSGKTPGPEVHDDHVQRERAARGDRVWTEHTYNRRRRQRARQAHPGRVRTRLPPTRPQPLRHDHHSPGVNRPCSSPARGLGATAA